MKLLDLNWALKDVHAMFSRFSPKNCWIPRDPKNADHIFTAGLRVRKIYKKDSLAASVLAGAESLFFCRSGGVGCTQLFSPSLDQIAQVVNCKIMQKKITLN